MTQCRINLWALGLKTIPLVGIGFIIGYKVASPPQPIHPNIEADTNIKIIANTPSDSPQNESIYHEVIQANPSTLSQLISQIDQQTPSSELANKILQSSPSKHKHWLLKNLMERWGEENPVEAFEYASALSEQDGGAELMEAISLNLNYHNFQETVSWLSQSDLSDANKTYLISQAYAGLARTSPRHAIQAASNLEDVSIRNRTIRAVVDEWSKKDAKSVLDWIGSVPMTANLQNLYTSTMSRYIEQNTTDASKLIEYMDQGEIKTTLATKYARHLSKTNPREAMRWSLSLDSSAAQKHATKVAFDAWVTQNQSEALEYALQLPSDDNKRNELLTLTATRVTRSSPIEASELIKSFPEEVQINVAEQIGISLAEIHPNASKEWIEQLPPGAMRDNAIKGALYRLRETDPQRAFDLAQTVSPSIVYKLLQETADAWNQTDPTAMTEAIMNTNSISSTQKYDILSNILNNKMPIDLILP